MAKRTSIKIDSELMQGIEAQIKEKPWFKSRTKFAEEAIKNEIKKLEDEENASVFSLIRAYYNEKQIYYAEQGIFGFEGFIKKVVLNESVADIIKKAGQESKKSDKKIEELTDKISAMERDDAKSEELMKKMPALVEKLIEAKLKIQEQRYEKEGLEKELRGKVIKKPSIS